MKVKQCHELYVSIENEVGVGAQVFASLVGVGADVIAFDGWQREGDARFAVVLDEDVERAHRALVKAGFKVEQRTAIAVDLANRPGSLVALLRTLADANIDVVHSYATGAGGKQTRVVLQTSDNQMASHLISTIPGRA